ncbi:hypothetical protein [Paraclostridium bifermentans]
MNPEIQAAPICGKACRVCAACHACKVPVASVQGATGVISAF